MSEPETPKNKNKIFKNNYSSDQREYHIRGGVYLLLTQRLLKFLSSFLQKDLYRRTATSKETPRCLLLSFNSLIDFFKTLMQNCVWFRWEAIIVHMSLMSILLLFIFYFFSYWS